MTILHRCLVQLQSALKDIESKIAIWVSNDPSFRMSDIVDAPLILNYVSRWPLVANLLCACFCLGCSATFHLVQIHSPKIYDLFVKLDYCGISVLMWGSSCPMLFYSFSCKPVFWVRNIFLAFVSTTSLLSFVGALHPVLNKPALRTVRAYLYVGLGLSTGVPFIYLANVPRGHEPYVNPGFELQPWVIGGAVYIIGAAIYALRIPEKHFPRTFDYIGQSHNIHHACVLAGCAIHFNASMNLYLARKEMVCPIDFPSM